MTKRQELLEHLLYTQKLDTDRKLYKHLNNGSIAALPFSYEQHGTDNVECTKWGILLSTSTSYNKGVSLGILEKIDDTYDIVYLVDTKQVSYSTITKINNHLSDLRLRMAIKSLEG